ncbi:MAG: cytochrome P450, partial [Dongiaceae bacterium]
MAADDTTLISGLPMTGDGTQALFVPPRPLPPKTNPSFWQFVQAARTNALLMWSDQAYNQPFIRQSFLGHTRLLLNDPAAIHHVLVGSPGNYRRPASIARIIRPITGDGLVLSEGEVWRHQRRTIAPALGPRVISLLCRHIAASLSDTIERLHGAAGEPVNMRRVLQDLALNIAGRSMFSLEMRDYGEAINTAMTRYNQRHARPHLLDLLLPPRIPAPRDFGRWRFRRAWMALVETIMEARLRLPPAETPRDLFDLLVAARDPETGQGFSRDQLRDQTATMILAGHETTSTTLFWSLTLLAQVPAEQERVAVEAASRDFSPGAAAATLADLPHTRAVVNEALRLYPPAFTLAREAIIA